MKQPSLVRIDGFACRNAVSQRSGSSCGFIQPAFFHTMSMVGLMRTCV
jgi:hypothetical protein